MQLLDSSLLVGSRRPSVAFASCIGLLQLHSALLCLSRLEVFKLLHRRLPLLLVGAASILRLPLPTVSVGTRKFHATWRHFGKGGLIVLGARFAMTRAE